MLKREPNIWLGIPQQRKPSSNSWQRSPIDPYLSILILQIVKVDESVTVVGVSCPLFGKKPKLHAAFFYEIIRSRIELWIGSRELLAVRLALEEWSMSELLNIWIPTKQTGHFSLQFHSLISPCFPMLHPITQSIRCIWNHRTPIQSCIQVLWDSRGHYQWPGPSVHVWSMNQFYGQTRSNH